MKEQETRAIWQGIVDSQPVAMAEDPEHITFRMRSVEGQFLEVCAPSTLFAEMTGGVSLGQPIAITGESILPGETPQMPIQVFADSAKLG